MNSDDLKEAAYGHIARMGKALASGPRLRILDLLTQGPRTVEEVAAEVSQSVANTSHHLRSLARAQLVSCQRSGTYVTYRLADDDVAIVFAKLRALAESRVGELADLRRDLARGQEPLEVLGGQELEQRLTTGEVTLLDVRPISEYSAGHLPGAISIPLGELESRIDELPQGRPIVAYCRGPYCVMAPAAVAKLRAAGFDAAHTTEGVGDWLARGLGVEVGA